MIVLKAMIKVLENQVFLTFNLSFMIWRYIIVI